MPPIFIFDNDKALLLEGSIIPNILPKISFSTDGFCRFLITFKPQKMKNIVTFLPVDAAPLAKTNEANARARSSLNTMNVLPLFGLTAFMTQVDGWFSLFSTVALTIPSELSTSMSLAPVILHHAATSLADAGSVAVIT